MVAGKSFCLTGTMAHSRNEMERRIREMGGKVSHKVTKGTDYLVQGKGGGRKAKDAMMLGVRVISEGKFMAMI